MAAGVARPPAGGRGWHGGRVMIFRTGRRVGRTLYLQTGPGPADGDPLVGVLDTPALARYVARAASARLELDVRAATMAVAGFGLSPICVACGCAAVFDPNEPTLQAPRWRHVDQVASYAVGAHLPFFG